MTNPSHLEVTPELEAIDKAAWNYVLGIAESNGQDEQGPIVTHDSDHWRAEFCGQLRYLKDHPLPRIFVLAASNEEQAITRYTTELQGAGFDVKLRESWGDELDTPQFWQDAPVMRTIAKYDEVHITPRVRQSVAYDYIQDLVASASNKSPLKVIEVPNITLDQRQDGAGHKTVAFNQLTQDLL